MTNLENAERLRSYYLTHKPRNNKVNLCNGMKNWNVCDYGDIYAGAGCECWKQDGHMDCVRCYEQSKDEWRKEK